MADPGSNINFDRYALEGYYADLTELLSSEAPDLFATMDGKGFNKPAHTDDWDIDEDAMQTGVRLFVQFVLDHMEGIESITQ